MHQSTWNFPFKLKLSLEGDEKEPGLGRSLLTSGRLLYCKNTTLVIPFPICRHPSSFVGGGEFLLSRKLDGMALEKELEL